MNERYTIKIMGTPYSVMTASMGDTAMRELLDKYPRASGTMAAIFAAIQFADGKRRAEETADNLRGQLRTYLEDMNKLRAELDELRRERG